MITTFVLILIFIINSISLKITSVVLVMPYLLYLSNYRREKNLLLIFLLSVIFSLQTDKLFFNSAAFFIFYFIFLLIRKHIKYQYLNIPIFSLIQMILWQIVFLKEVKPILIASFVLCNLVNFLYLKIYKRKFVGVIK